LQPTLDALGREHGTDKASGRHAYLNTYERYLAPMRDHPVRLLELGIFNGASLRVWRDYFTQGKIVGCDLHGDRRQHADERIAVEIGDCGSAAFLNSVAEKHGPFDVIIDDASHIWKHQQVAFTTLFDHLRPGGVFIIEDLHTSAIPKYEGGLGGQPTVAWLKDAVDHVVALPYEKADEPDLKSLKRWRRQVQELIFIRKACLIIRAPSTS
jgi:SAM-dependent methyltransferase